jgi:hypothetical protein
MNILYKYCDPLGVVKILGALELKLPNISEVNDPLECLPVFYCPKDKNAIEALYFSALKRRGMLPSGDYKQKLEKGEIHKMLEESQRELQRELNQKSYLLSVSKTAQNTVMWAHYADKHKGTVIGIDFDKIFPKVGIKMHRVDYSEQRPKINVLDDFREKFSNALLTKSSEWTYEQEFRAMFDDVSLMDLQQQGVAHLKDFNDKKTWFLRLNPKSIKEIIFGLYTEESLKLAIRKLTEQSELQHIKLYQAEESETYILNLVEIENQQKRG